MTSYADEVLNRLVVQEVPEKEDVAKFVANTLAFGTNGMNLPKRQLTDAEVGALRKSWVE